MDHVRASLMGIDRCGTMAATRFRGGRPCFVRRAGAAEQLELIGLAQRPFAGPLRHALIAFRDLDHLQARVGIAHVLDMVPSVFRTLEPVFGGSDRIMCHR